jgi:hypothetical protein
VNPTPNPTLRRIFLLLILAAAGMAALLALLPPAGHDQLWFLLMAHRWLAGAPVYGPEIFDSNPPGVVWLSALPDLLAQTLHLSTTFVAKSLVTLAETASALLSLHLLRRARPTLRDYELPALLFAAIVLFYIVPARDFGQRDQMLSFLVLPYILAAAIPFREHKLTVARCLAALFAAAGICLKPHHALLVIAVELTLLALPATNLSTRLKRLLRPEPFLILALGAAFLFAIRRLTPLYFTSALPILHDTYWAIGNLSLFALLWQAIELVLLATLVLTLYVRSTARSPIVLLLIAAACASSLAYLLQGTGWYYQQLPAICLFGVALALQLLDILSARSITPPRRAVAATAALSLLALVLTATFTGFPITTDRAYAPVFANASVPDPAFFTALPPGTSVAVLTTSVEAAMMPVERFHLTWAQRTNNLWLLPAILRTESPGTGHPPSHVIPAHRIAELDDLQHRWMVEDLNRWHPQLILVDRCQKAAIHCQELEDRDDDLLAWFQRDPTFQTLWSHYTYAGTRGDFDAYTRK